jgi:hypothetical protein
MEFVRTGKGGRSITPGGVTSIWGGATTGVGSGSGGGGSGGGCGGNVIARAGLLPSAGGREARRCSGSSHST